MTRIIAGLIFIATLGAVLALCAAFAWSWPKIAAYEEQPSIGRMTP